MVSGRVVYTRRVSLKPEILKSISAPTDLPIQFLCMSFKDSGQSKSSRSFNNRSAYAVILSTHCRIGLRITGKLPTSLFPSITSSLANTVPNSGHQFTATSSSYANPVQIALKISIVSI